MDAVTTIAHQDDLHKALKAVIRALEKELVKTRRSVTEWTVTAAKMDVGWKKCERRRVLHVKYWRDAYEGLLVSNRYWKELYEKALRSASGSDGGSSISRYPGDSDTGMLSLLSSPLCAHLLN